MPKALISRDGRYEDLSVVIAVSTTVSSAFASKGCAMFGLVIPSTFDGTVITFQSSADGTTYQALSDSAGAAVSMTVAASKNYDLPSALAPWPYWKIVCSTAQTTTDTVFQVCSRG